MFNTGDKVFVYRDHHDREPYEQTIYRVTSRYVVLMDGAKYALDGKQWGAGRSWFYSRIEAATDERRAELAEQRASKKREQRKQATIKAIVNFVSDMSTDELEQLAAHLRNMGMPLIAD